MPTPGTFRQPQRLDDRSDPAVLYVLSYLITRTVVGFLGILLPIAFIVGEAFYLRGSVQIRGSISAYYHTPMRDLFVAGLCVIGFLLMTYMSAQTRTWDFWLSLVAGIAVVGVAFFPTRRPGLASGAPPCGGQPVPAGCAPMQQALGETTTAVIHFTCAAVFMLSLAAIAFLFGYREKRFGINPGMALVQQICGWAIIAAIAWAVLGFIVDLTVWELTPLYVGEVVSVWAFGISWLLKGRDLRALLGLRNVPRSPRTAGELTKV
ncbi:hypothetical protein [Rhizomonospora bruguierae]|uniref:hypothetical protein n=1 Tax=Rhizomonospora bruguierae TaxID=1581705 RepID=UPI001BCC64DE|nr:hypothetical protein [Micromonospora sp. NBRC 107566]